MSTIEKEEFNSSTMNKKQEKEKPNKRDQISASFLKHFFVKQMCTPFN